jgi:hypothetical protein
MIQRVGNRLALILPEGDPSRLIRTVNVNEVHARQSLNTSQLSTSEQCLPDKNCDNTLLKRMSQSCLRNRTLSQSVPWQKQL